VLTPDVSGLGFWGIDIQRASRSEEHRGPKSVEVRRASNIASNRLNSVQLHLDCMPHPCEWFCAAR
jgi:hypothetical protein